MSISNWTIIICTKFQIDTLSIMEVIDENIPIVKWEGYSIVFSQACNQIFLCNFWITQKIRLWYGWRAWGAMLNIDFAKGAIASKSLGTTGLMNHLLDIKNERVTVKKLINENFRHLVIVSFQMDAGIIEIDFYYEWYKRQCSIC